MNIIDEVNKIKTSNSNLKEYQSKPIMTKYELNSIISLRTTHLANMAIPFVELPNNFKIQNNMDLRKIVLMELKQGVLPYLVKRVLPNKKIEYFKIKDKESTAICILLRD